MRDDRETTGGGEGAEEVADLLSEIGRLFKARLRSLPDSPAGALSVPQRDVLVRIGRRPGATPASVSERTGRDPGQVTRLVAELEELGLVRRARSLEDRRSVSLSLSDSGAALFARMLERRAALAGEMLSELTASEERLLRSLLGRLRSGLRDASSDAPSPRDGTLRSAK